MNVQTIMTNLEAKHPGEKEYLQAVREVLESVEEVYNQHPEFEKAKIEEILKIFCDTEDYGVILRSKGMVESTDGTWIYFDMVPGEYELREGTPDYTGRLCVIGTNIDEHKLEELFGIA